MPQFANMVTAWLVCRMMVMCTAAQDLYLGRRAELEQQAEGSSDEEEQEQGWRSSLRPTASAEVMGGAGGLTQQRGGRPAGGAMHAAGAAAASSGRHCSRGSASSVTTVGHHESEGAEHLLETYYLQVGCGARGPGGSRVHLSVYHGWSWWWPAG
jgi:hypothetical protein